MQTINLDISTKGILPPLYAKQGDVGRKVRFAISDGGVPYNIPEDALLSVWYSGSSGEGNYDTVGENSAFSIDGNAVTVELIPQMVLNNGGGTMCLVISTSGGRQIGLWNLRYQIEVVPGMESDKVTERYDSLFKRTDAAVTAAENAATHAEDAATCAENAAAVAAIEAKNAAEVSTALFEAKASGEFNGYSPVRGVDYWTEADKTEVVKETEETAIGDIEKATAEIIKMQEELLDCVEVTYPVDTTLTQEGTPADAKAVGDRLAEIASNSGGSNNCVTEKNLAAPAYGFYIDSGLIMVLAVAYDWSDYILANCVYVYSIDAFANTFLTKIGGELSLDIDTDWDNGGAYIVAPESVSDMPISRVELKVWG